jgi:hypothetical protein
VFLNNSEVDTYERCLRFCCETPMCSVAVWDQQNGGCYLFDCGPSTPEEFKCRDRSYKTPFLPKTFPINFHPQVLDKGPPIYNLFIVDNNLGF